MKIKDSKGVAAFRIINAIILTLLAVACFYPMYHVIMASFSDGNALIAHRGLLLRPLNPNIAAYKKIFEYPVLLRSYANTLIICCVTLVFNIVLTSFAAYVLTRKETKIRGVVMMMILFTMYFQGGLVPTYMLVRNLGMLDSIWSLILPGAISTYNMIVLRTSFAALPESLSESARVEGAGHFQILFQIVMPLSKATLAVIVLYYLVAQWNSWFDASIYLKTRSKYPLQLVLREILIQNDTGEMGQGVLDSDKQAIGEVIKYAAITVSTVPILCLYPFLQKYFTKGVMIGAVKG